MIYIIFKRKSDETLDFFGRIDNNPRKYILKTIEIPPDTMRPSLRGYTGEDDTYNDSTVSLPAVMYN